MTTKEGLYPAEKYVDEYAKDESEECRRCKGGCRYIGMSGEYARIGFRPMTNAEKIRKMSDEDLAEWLGYICDSWYEPKGGWLAWLRKEVE